MPSADVLRRKLSGVIVPDDRLAPRQWMQPLEKCLDRARDEIRQQAIRSRMPANSLDRALTVFDTVRQEIVSGAPPLSVAYSDIIRSIAWGSACAGGEITLHCSARPDAGDPVLMPVRGRWAVVPILRQRSASGEILVDVTIPEDASHGPVGFLHAGLQRQWVDYCETVNRQLREYSKRYLRAYLGRGGSRNYTMLDALSGGLLRAPLDHPAESPFNRFVGTVPEVNRFEIDGGREVVLQPGQTVTLSWQVWNADEIRILRQTSAPMSSWPILHQSGTASGNFAYTASSADSREQRLVLQATNACGATQRAVLLHVRMPSLVTVAGVEAVQSVQEFAFGNPALSNTVPLLRRKRTMVRVYLDSGLQPAFQGGVLTDVMGVLTIGGRRVQALQPAAISRDVRGSRASLGRSLNFVVEPQWVQGERFTVSIEIFSNDPHAMWPRTSATLDLPLQDGASFNLHLFHVIDKNGVMPSNSEVQTSLDKLAAILPVADDGLSVKGAYYLPTELDFNDDSAWFQVNPFSSDLFDLMESAANSVDGQKGDIYCGIVARASCDSARGYAWPGGLDWAGGTSQRIAYWRASLASEFDYVEAHEFGHTCNLNENDTRQYGLGVDLSIPHQPRLLAGADQMMDASSNQRWISAAEYLWVLYRDFWKVIGLLEQYRFGGSISVFALGI